MFWWSWSAVNVTGAEAVPAFWPTALAAQKQESETAKVFRNKRTVASQNGILAAPQKSDLLRAIIINLTPWTVH
jgi:hypothetical protein